MVVMGCPALCPAAQENLLHDNGTERPCLKNKNKNKKKTPGEKILSF